MINYQSILPSYKLIFAFFAIVNLFPFISYSQQTPVKRIEVVVEVKEKSGTEIIQLPASNLPTTLDKKTKTSKQKNTVPAFSSSKKTKSNSQVVAKAEPKSLSVASKVIQPVKAKQELVKPKEQASPNQTSLSKLKPAPQQKEALETNIKAQEKPKIRSNNSKANTAINTAEAEYSNYQITETGKQNTITYVWIGVMLIVAGVVLGMLFGRTAFLVSFIGVIFIVLGVFIF